MLAVDPSSNRTGGSILGDKTRMPRLANDDNAFIRPSPSSGTLGGVAAKTRETMLLCEAAGYDVILVETVGVGQSETAVADMTDVFLVLMLPGAGDELQGIKKGVVELADMIAVNKADGDNIKRAKQAAAEYRAALHILKPPSAHWSPPVLTYSALTGDGITELWKIVGEYREKMTAAGEIASRRRQQQVKWMWAMLEDRLHARLRSDPSLKTKLPQIEKSVAAGKLSPMLAVEQIADGLGSKDDPETNPCLSEQRSCTNEKTTMPRDKPVSVLITGFGPFPGAPSNPSRALIERAGTHAPPGVERRADRIACVRNALRRDRPRLRVADRRARSRHHPDVRARGAHAPHPHRDTGAQPDVVLSRCRRICPGDADDRP